MSLLSIYQTTLSPDKEVELETWYSQLSTEQQKVMRDQWDSCPTKILTWIVPKFVSLGHTTLRLFNQNTYFRDGGNWEIGWKFKENKLVAVSFYDPTKNLGGTPLIPINKETWAKNNGGYLPKVCSNNGWDLVNDKKDAESSWLDPWSGTKEKKHFAWR